MSDKIPTRQPAGTPTGGQFAASVKAEATDVSLAVSATTIAVPSPSSGAVDDEAEALEVLLESLREKTEWPESQHYDEADLAAIEERIEHVESALARKCNLRHPDPAVRLDAAIAEAQAAEARVAEAAAASLSATIKAAHPTAAYVALEGEEDGPGCACRHVFAADGTLLTDIGRLDDDSEDAEDAGANGWPLDEATYQAAAWLRSGGHAWEHLRADDAIAHNAGLPLLRL